MSIHSVNSTQSIYSIESFLVLTKKGCPIRKSTDLRLFAPTRGLSQLITSFIASMCLGIHRTPLVAFTKDFSILRKRVDAYANQIVKKQSKKSTKLCGADRDRTCDLRLAKPALSQLSYSPPFLLITTLPFPRTNCLSQR